MAALLNQYLIRRLPQVLNFLRTTQRQSACTTCRRFSRCCSLLKDIKNNEQFSIQSINSKTGEVSLGLTNPVKFDRSFLKQTTDRSSTARCSSLRCFSTSADRHNWSDGQSNHSGEQPERNILKLMNFPLRMLPNPLKAIRNIIMETLVRRMDRDFSRNNFLEGAQQAVIAVSSLISRGNFDGLYGLVDAGALHEIKENYKRLDATQRQMIHIDPENIQARFIYEIGMMWEEIPERMVEVEVTTVFHCVPVTPLDMEKYQVCNYRFIRRFSAELEPVSDWTINRLNHFLLHDITNK